MFSTVEVLIISREPQSECVMRNAAAKAGFEKVQLLLEPLCAAALDIQLLKEAGNLKVWLPYLLGTTGPGTRLTV